MLLLSRMIGVTGEKEILYVAQYSGQALNEATVNRITSIYQQQLVANSQNDNIDELNEHKNMTLTNEMIFLCEKLGDHGHLNLMDVTIANRFRNSFFF